MKSHLFNNLLCTFVVTALTSCAVITTPSMEPDTSATAFSTVPASSTYTASPPAAATATAISTRSFSLPTSLPPSDGTVLYLDRLLFEDVLVPGCNLPCWRGLVIGQSTPDDIKYVFDNSFGTHGERNVGLVTLTVLGVHDRPSVGYLWQVEGDTHAGNFSVAARVDPATGKLDSLKFGGSSSNLSRLEIHLSPELVIKALGKPDRIYGHAEILGTIHEGLGELVLVYNKKGLVFYFYQDIQTQVTFDTSLTKVQQDIFPFCLGKTKATHNERIHAEMLIVPPLEDGLDRLSANQEDLILSYEVRQRLLPVQDIFNVTEEEFAQLALSGNNVCLESKNLWPK